jgi:hypothetical protein
LRLDLTSSRVHEFTLVFMSDSGALEAVREFCATFPETSERPSHRSPTFFIRDKKTFANFHADHHGDGRTAIWFAAPPGVQEQ